MHKNINFITVLGNDKLIRIDRNAAHNPNINKNKQTYNANARRGVWGNARRVRATAAAVRRDSRGERGARGDKLEWGHIEN